jgi:hypothetical protein
MRRLLGLLIGVALFGAAQGEWIQFDAQMEEMRPEITLLASSEAGGRFEVRMPGIELSSAVLEGKRWDRVEIPGGGFEQEIGKPEVPHVTRLFAIPADVGVRVEAVVVAERVLKNIELMPAQGIAPDEGEDAGRIRHWDASCYSQDRFFPERRVVTGEPAILRDLRVIPVQVNPMQYNPVTKELRIAERMEVILSFEGRDLRNALTRTPRRFSLSWAKIARANVVNFDEVGEVDENLAGSYLVICENDPTLVNHINTYLLDWKRRMGHMAVVETFSPGASATTIKNIIQTAYDTWEIPPEFVLLFGDNDGDYALPGWDYYVGDHPYAQLAGNDILADVAVGRIPAGNLTEALAMINKVIWYEKQPYTVHDEWFHRSVLLANVQTSGISTIQTKRSVKTYMVQNGFTQIDTLWWNMSGSTVSVVSNAINNGVSYFNYRGYLGLSGWTNNNTSQLTNGYKLPFVTILTCGTGGFSGNSSMEHFATVGTPTTGQGAVAAVGTATSGTNTRCNNVVDLGMYFGIFNEGITQAGNSLVRGKLELYNAYNTINTSFVDNFSKWNNLAGDPGLELWTGPIQSMQAQVPDQLTLGNNQLNILVSDVQNNPIPGALVCAYKSGEIQQTVLTDDAGVASLLLGTLTAGNLKVTVTKHNYKPVLDSLDVVQQNVIVGFLAAVVDDDNLGESQGDDDGTINPGETIEVPLTLKNFGSSVTAVNVALTATVNDPFILPGDMVETFGTIPPGGTAVSLDDIDFHVQPNAPDRHIIHFNLAITSGQGNWNSAMELAVAAAALESGGVIAVGGDSLLSPGETAQVEMRTRNAGGHRAENVTAVIRSLDALIIVSDSIGSYGTIQSGASALNSVDRFQMTASPNTPRGYQAKMRIEWSLTNGSPQVDTIAVTIGQKVGTDPQGPDAYGYYCYDDTDVNYPPHPVYSWVEIDPDYGGSGTQLAILDNGEDQDASLNIALPFPFRYYGINVDSITVCSNGWISMIPNVALTLFRNWPIPSVMGPAGMVAPFWDDLVTTGEGRIYAWHDQANHRVVIEWSRMQNFGSPNPPETFEIILFDPAYYPTPTGDGEILFQYYHIVEVSGNYWDNAYSTVGIETPDQMGGIEVVYSNQYHDPAAAHLQDGRAYLFTTRFDYTPPGSALQITMTPVNPPIVIPAGGGSFSFTVGLANTGTAPLTADAWIDVILPNGSVFGPTLGPVNLTLPAGFSLQRNRSQNVPGNAPAGTYRYRGNIGVYPTAVYDSSSFTFSKAGSELSTLYDDWDNYGEPWGEELLTNSTEPILPEEFALYPAHPNPFNPQTVVGFALPRAERIHLAVYDIAGRQVAVLVDSRKEAGRHEVVFDGSGLASGVYICRLQAGGYSAGLKMVMLK